MTSRLFEATQFIHCTYHIPPGLGFSKPIVVVFDLDDPGLRSVRLKAQELFAVSNYESNQGTKPGHVFRMLVRQASERAGCGEIQRRALQLLLSGDEAFDLSPFHKAGIDL